MWVLEYPAISRPSQDEFASPILAPMPAADLVKAMNFPGAECCYLRLLNHDVNEHQVKSRYSTFFRGKKGHAIYIRIGPFMRIKHRPRIRKLDV